MCDRCPRMLRQRSPEAVGVRRRVRGTPGIPRVRGRVGLRVRGKPEVPRVRALDFKQRRLIAARVSPIVGHRGRCHLGQRRRHPPNRLRSNPSSRSPLAPFRARTASTRGQAATRTSFAFSAGWIIGRSHGSAGGLLRHRTRRRAPHHGPWGTWMGPVAEEGSKRTWWGVLPTLLPSRPESSRRASTKASICRDEPSGRGRTRTCDPGIMSPLL